jgi:amidophosphoribosyltransferase
MPHDQNIRNLVVKMKLNPVREFIKSKRSLFYEDSIVRGTQLQDTIRRHYDARALE